jgi:hypothetical protein
MPKPIKLLTLQVVRSFIVLGVLCLNVSEIAAQDKATYYRLWKVSYLNRLKNNRIVISGNLVLAKRTQSNKLSFYENDNFFRARYQKHSDSFTVHTMTISPQKEKKHLSVPDHKWKPFIKSMYIGKRRMIINLKNGVQYLFLRYNSRHPVLSIARDSLKFLYLINPNSLYTASYKLRDTFFKRYTVLKRKASFTRSVKSPVGLDIDQGIRTKNRYYIPKLYKDSTDTKQLLTVKTKHRMQKGRVSNFELRDNSKLINGSLIQSNIPFDKVKKIRFTDNVTKFALYFFATGVGFSATSLFWALFSVILGNYALASEFTQFALIAFLLGMVFLPLVKVGFRPLNKVNEKESSVWTLINR